jgi:hypothetical protein
VVLDRLHDLSLEHGVVDGRLNQHCLRSGLFIVLMILRLEVKMITHSEK